MPTRFTFFDGKKSYNVPDPWNSTLGWVTIFGDSEKPTQDVLYGTVAAVYRAVNLTADATASLPFAIVNKNGQDVDTSDNWQNAVGFMPNPRDLIRRWRTSLFMTNAAYAFMESERGKKLSNLRYLVPTTIQPDADADGLKGFYRSFSSRRKFYPLEEKRLFYIFKLDYDTELLPSDKTEFAALMSSAGILYYADFFVGNFFETGGVKPSMLMVKGVPNKADAERIESIWDKLRRNVYKYAGKIFNAEAMEVHELGNGISDLKDTGIYEKAIRNIALASGIPVSLFLNEAANMATADVYTSWWYNYVLVPTANMIADALTDQVFAPLGMRWEFRPEQASPNQAEEVQRSGSWLNFVNGGVKQSVAAQIVGIDMPAGVEYSDLDPAPAPEQPAPSPAEPVKAIELPPVTTDPIYTLNLAQWKEIDAWQGIATRKAKRKESLVFAFETKCLPINLAEQIRRDLSDAGSVADVEEIFCRVLSVPETKAAPATDDSALLALADAINKSANPIKATYRPTAEMADVARQALEWRREYNRGGTEVGVARARDISNRASLPLDTIGRMVSFFARHEVNKQAEGFSAGEDGFPSAGRIAWDLWGGDPGKAWADGIWEDERGEPAKSAPFAVTINQEAQPVNITMPAMQPQISLPAQAAPVVNINVEPTPVTIENGVTVEPAPVTVQNTINVEPTPVEIENQNNVTVQPADVVMPHAPSGAKVVRDGRGVITGIETVE